ncbi:MAG: hypothetical protein BMS9Abin13_604 [Patescibacteria group bacterium]|nr:MAG: hypothetical protein BMS9Abin13_604 [Patescibacteria group bacterium]
MLKKLKIALLATLFAFSFTFFGVAQAAESYNSSRSNLSQKKVPVSKGTKQNDAAKDKKEKSSKNYDSSRPKGK